MQALRVHAIESFTKATQKIIKNTNIEVIEEKLKILLWKEIKLKA